MDHRKISATKGSVKKIYARVKQEFSAADLQKYTEMEKGIPAEQVLADMEKIHQKKNCRKNA